MDTAPAPASSDDDSDSSVQSSNEGDDFTVVTGKKRARKQKSVPSKAPKPASRPPTPTGPSRPPTPPPSGAKTPAPPPLFIQDKSKWTAVSGWCTEHHINFRSARSTQQGIKVQVTSSDDHRALTRVLKAKQVAFHTYTLPEERLLRVVIRGVPKELSSVAIKESLIAQHLPVHEVHRMVRARSQEPFDMVLVSLDRSEAGKAIFKLTKLCQLSGITVEPPRKRGTVSQCHRCQLYGHSARNCFARPRCVKCLEDHATADCKRPKDRTLCDEPPACVLCGSVGHPANYRGCPKAPRPQKPKPSASPRNPPSARAPTVAPISLSPQRPSAWGVLNSQSAFPPLPMKAPVGQKPAHQPAKQPANKPANNMASAIKPQPAAVPLPSAPVNVSHQKETDFSLVARFASLANFAEVKQLATSIRMHVGNPAALIEVFGRHVHILEAFQNFSLNP